MISHGTNSGGIPAGRAGRIGPGLQEQLPVATVHIDVSIHIAPGTTGPVACGSQEALLEVVQIISVYLIIAIEVSAPIYGDSTKSDVIPFGQIRQKPSFGSEVHVRVDAGLCAFRHPGLDDLAID